MNILRNLFSLLNIIMIYFMIKPDKHSRLYRHCGFFWVLLAVLLSVIVRCFENSLDVHIVYTYLTVSFIILLFGKLFWGYSLKNSFLVNCLFLMLVSIAQVLSFTLEYIETKKVLYLLPVQNQIYIFIIAEAIIFFGMLAVKHIVRKIPLEINTLSFVAIIIPILMMIAIMSFMGDKIYTSVFAFANIESFITTLTAGLLMLVGSICNIAVLAHYLNVKMLENERKLEISEGILQYNYYKKLENDMEDMRRFSHDMRNHLEALQGYNDADQKTEYIKNIEKKLNMYESYYNTGNTFIDNLLHRKKLDAVEFEIDFKVFADLQLFNFIKNEELCVIFSNAVDNAIRECRLSKEEKPECDNLIVIKAGKYKGFLSIICENTIRKEQEGKIINFENIETTKHDKDHHGYGIKNIKSTVQRYGGEVTIYVRDGIFCLSIIIPIE